MIYYRKGIIYKNENYISFTFSLSTDDKIDINDFYKNTDHIFDVDGNIEDLSDKIYQECPDNYKVYDISINVCQNDIFGYNKEYSKNNTTVTILKDNDIAKGAVIADGMTTEVYNIKNIPDDIKQIICGCTIEKTPPITPDKQMDNTITSNSTTDDGTNNSTTNDNTDSSKPIPNINIPEIDIPNDVDPNTELGIKAENMMNSDTTDNKNLIDNGIDNIENNVGNDMKKLDMSRSVAFNNLFDKTLSMMDDIGPSPDLVSELHNPDETISNKIKNFFGKKLI